jgi:ATP-dependent Clp protease adaptor protein ClpS
MFPEPKCSTLASPILEEKTDTDEQLGIPWKVIVLNDPVNLMNYVVMVFRKVFGYNETKATKHMMEVHDLGKSVLWVGEREQAENYAYQLQRWRLQTILEKDD